MTMTKTEIVKLMNALDEGIMQAIAKVTDEYEGKGATSDEMFSAVLGILSKISASAAIAYGASATQFTGRMQNAYRLVESHHAVNELLSRVSGSEGDD
jgi:hypothetical protein